jgi:aminopeptidase N
MGLASGAVQVLLWLILFGSAVMADQATGYWLEVGIDPSAGSLEVRGEVEVELSRGGPRDLTFRLHESLQLREIALGGRQLETRIAPAEPTRLQPATKRVSVRRPEAAGAGKIRLSVDYGGRLRRFPQFGTAEAEETGFFLDDVVESSRVELASYSAWYPQLGGFGPTFDADLTVEMPEGWTVVGLGEPTDLEQKKGKNRIRWRAKAVNDLVLIASPDFQVVRVDQDGHGVEIYHTRLPQGFVTEELKEISDALGLFERTLGKPVGDTRTVRHVYSPRAAGQGGYSRAPLIVSSEGLVLEGLKTGKLRSTFGGIAHEAAHFWWSFGVGQGDWINESFAEFFSRYALERIQGDEEALARLRKPVCDLPREAPSLAQVPPENSGYGYAIRYYKGSLMLDTLRKALGDVPFFFICRDFHAAFQARQIGTKELRGFWRSRLGEHAALLDRWLDFPGSAPLEGCAEDDVSSQ